MTKLAELKAAAEAVDVPMYLPERTRDDIQSLQQAWILYHNLANPATILKLIAVVEVADGLKNSAMSTTFEQLRAALKEMNDD
jgi:hypothetical protein